MTVTIDTNILLHLLRNSYLVPTIREELLKLGAEETMILSIVSVAEIESIAFQRDYGQKKKNHLKSLLKQFLVVPIESADLIDAYAELDAYSQGKLSDKPLPVGMSSRNMGKNDLWVAATALVTNSALVTTDKDFEHLDGVYLNYRYINPKKNN